MIEIIRRFGNPRGYIKYRKPYTYETTQLKKVEFDNIIFRWGKRANTAVYVKEYGSVDEAHDFLFNKYGKGCITFMTVRIDDTVWCFVKADVKTRGCKLSEEDGFKVYWAG